MVAMSYLHASIHFCFSPERKRVVTETSRSLSALHIICRFVQALLSYDSMPCSRAGRNDNYEYPMTIGKNRPLLYRGAIALLTRRNTEISADPAVR